MRAGDTLNVEIEIECTDTTDPAYDTYGLEFRLMSRGLSYNNDGASFASGTPVKLLRYDSGDSVGFAYYDMEQIGQSINNPALAGRWSYTVVDPYQINITVPVALLYITDDPQAHEPVGNAILYLDTGGGEIIGIDVSGEYPSGTGVSLPDAKYKDGYRFIGWSDGVTVYPAGTPYVVTGIVTLVAEYEGVERNRQIIFDPNGGKIIGDDPSGMYADGDVVVFPEAERSNHKFLRWEYAGTSYKPGDTYTVDNSIVFIAQWKQLFTPEGEMIDDSIIPQSEWFYGDDGTLSAGKIAAWCCGGAALIGGLLWWLILAKRRYVLYSLKDGAVALAFKDKEHDAAVEVVLLDKDENDKEIEYRLNKSSLVKADHKLAWIDGNLSEYPIAPVKAGKYKGKLLIGEGAFHTEKECRIKVLDRELAKRENE